MLTAAAIVLAAIAGFCPRVAVAHDHGAAACNPMIILAIGVISYVGFCLWFYYQVKKAPEQPKE